MNSQFFVFGGLLIVYMGFTSVNPIFAPLARELGLSEIQAGFLISISALAFTLFGSPWDAVARCGGANPCSCWV